MPRPPLPVTWLLPFVGTVALGLSTATAATWEVPAEAPTIQAGIDSASNGDTVLVAPGTYTGLGNREIMIQNKEIVLKSESGAESTIIDAQGRFPDELHRVFEWITGVTSVTRIEGFTITGGRAGGPVGESDGAGILCVGGSPTISRCIIRGNWSGDSEPYQPSKGQSSRLGCGWGGGLAIAFTESPMRIEDCIIEANGATCDGGAVVIYASHDLEFERCVIADNRELGIQVREQSSITFTNCTLAGNPSIAPGGAGGTTLYVSDSLSFVTLERTIVWSNCVGGRIFNEGSILSICSVVDTASVFGSGQIEYSGPNVFSNPLFCAPNNCSVWPPAASGDYRVQGLSPCLPQNNACGVLIGARDVCAATEVPWSTEPSAWVSAFPNPFRGSTTFALGDAVHGEATLTVFDTSGRRVRVFEVTASSGPVSWDGTDESGTRVGPGIYFLRVANGRSNSSGRVTLIR